MAFYVDKTKSCFNSGLDSNDPQRRSPLIIRPIHGQGTLLICRWSTFFSSYSGLKKIDNDRRFIFVICWLSLLIKSFSINWTFIPASPKAKAGLGVQSLRPSVCPSVRPKIFSSQLLWNYWSDFNETWYDMVLCISAGHFDPLNFVGVTLTFVTFSNPMKLRKCMRVALKALNDWFYFVGFSE